MNITFTTPTVMHFLPGHIHSFEGLLFSVTYSLAFSERNSASLLSPEFSKQPDLALLDLDVPSGPCSASTILHFLEETSGSLLTGFCRAGPQYYVFKLHTTT